MEIQEFHYESRLCECCGNDSLEALFDFEHIASTSRNKWKFSIRDVICRKCGFVFVSPCPVADQLLMYYSETFVKYHGQQIDFNCAKRINFIKESVASSYRKTFLEIGAHTKTTFHYDLENIFEKVLTVEPNKGANGDYNDTDAFLGSKLDVVAHYFVLEHVPNVKTFLLRCYDLLRPGGVMICEVPDLLWYPKDISALILHEHVNHFTPSSLIQICRSIGFKVISHSQTSCSRSFGFVIAFEKTIEELPQNLETQYTANKAAFTAGLHQLTLFNQRKARLLSMIEAFKKDGQKILIWGANDNLIRLFDGDKGIPDHVTIADSNPKKKSFLPSKEVMLPEEVAKILDDISTIILTTNLHAKSILNMLESSFNKTFRKENVHLFDYYDPLN